MKAWRFYLPTLFAAALGVSATLISSGATAQAGSLGMLANLAKGEWTLKSRDGSLDRKICVRTGMELIQLRHREQNCSRFVVEDEAQEVVVQYTCPGNGYGRTKIRQETPSLLQVQTQGIVEGLPFQANAEARRTGTCR